MIGLGSDKKNYSHHEWSISGWWYIQTRPGRSKDRPPHLKAKVIHAFPEGCCVVTQLSQDRGILLHDLQCFQSCSSTWRRNSGWVNVALRLPAKHLHQFFGTCHKASRSSTKSLEVNSGESMDDYESFCYELKVMPMKWPYLIENRTFGFKEEVGVMREYYDSGLIQRSWWCLEKAGMIGL